MDRNLRVGIIGASAERGWAKISHVPAIQQLAGLELAAVVTRDQRSADTAAKAFGAAKGYGDAKNLFADPDIDIVTVGVNVPAHRDLVLGALAAGKHIYCEYPLGRNLAETEELAAAATKAGVHVAIGLQARGNPVVRQARAIIDTGAIGRVLSARVVSTTMAFGPEVERAMAFAEQPGNGVSLVTIQGAHTVDLVTALLGEFAEWSALASTQFPDVQVEEAGGKSAQKRETPDHLLVMARLADGAPVSIEVAGGRPVDATPFHLEVTGQTGVLALEGGAPRGFQSGVFRLLRNGEEQPIDPAEVTSPDTAVNVAATYAALRDDIRHGTRTTPDFHHAAHLTRVMDNLLSSSMTGARMSRIEGTHQ